MDQPGQPIYRLYVDHIPRRATNLGQGPRDDYVCLPLTFLRPRGAVPLPSLRRLVPSLMLVHPGGVLSFVAARARFLLMVLVAFACLCACSVLFHLVLSLQFVLFILQCMRRCRPKAMRDTI